MGSLQVVNLLNLLPFFSPYVQAIVKISTYWSRNGKGTRGMWGHRRWMWAGLFFLLFLGWVRFTGSDRARRHGPAGSAVARHLQTGLMWPWLPGGVLTPPPHFASIPFGVQIVPDANLPQGQELLIHPGVQGLRFISGHHVVTMAPPRSAVIAEGTATVHILSVGGHTYHYVRVLSMVATAYNGSYAMNGPWGGIAAWTGQPLHQGDVAVDPSVIPLGTKLFVQGYGPAVADDTGSAIWGDRIDLFFNQPASQIARFGIRTVKVYELGGP